MFYLETTPSHSRFEGYLKSPLTGTYKTNYGLAPENSWKPRGFALKEVLFKQFALSYTA
jgi:hypothetical protein